MLMVLSPAKKMDFDAPLRSGLHTEAQLPEHTAELITLLRELSAADLAQLMTISPKLAELNAERYAQWRADPGQRYARAAVFAFNGDVYDGLRAAELSDAELHWAQRHLAILSGLYGVLRPLDLIQAHRLEMGTRLRTARGANLYEFWGDLIASALNQRLDELGGARILVNLASQEYFKSVDLARLRATVIECVFQDWQRDSWRVVSFHAKRARGLMARYVIDQAIDQAAGLENFKSAGYGFDAPASTPTRLVFRRKQ